MKVNEECTIIGHSFKPRFEIKRARMGALDNEWDTIFFLSILTIVLFPIAVLAYYFAGQEKKYVCDVCSRCGLRSG